MSLQVPLNQQIINELTRDAQEARNWGIVLIIGGLLVQLLHYVDIRFSGITFMLVLTGGIMVVSGIFFTFGSFNVPKNRKQLITQLQKVMMDSNPKRRLWAAQRLIGYAKGAQLSKQEILALATHGKRVVKNPPGKNAYKPYIAVDHLVFLREMAVSIPMTKHVRKDFVQIIRPLQKIKEMPDEGQEMLADAISYHPSKLPIQAFADLEKLKESEDN